MNDSIETPEAEEPGGSVSPVLEGLADFAHVWTPEGPVAEGPAPTPPPNLPNGFAERYGAQVFRSAADIHQFFTAQTGKHFNDWFNAEIAGRGSWINKKISGTNLASKFDAYWNAHSQPNGVSLLEFIAYMCIFINERNGDLVSKSEMFGAPRHPGVAYLFDSFVVGSPGHQFRKASYNVSPNIKAGDLFNNDDFNAAHGARALASTLRGSHSPVWQGQTFPQGTVSTSGNPTVTGYLLQADFFKFRGRGLIQTTWRNHYAALVQSIQSYAGQNTLIRSYRDKWKNLSPDVACTISSNEDWDILFETTDNEIVCEAIRRHAKAGRYIPLSHDSSTINGSHAGSLQFMGTSIGGGNYGALMKGRAVQICVALGKIA